MSELADRLLNYYCTLLTSMSLANIGIPDIFLFNLDESFLKNYTLSRKKKLTRATLVGTVYMCTQSAKNKSFCICRSLIN